MTTASVLLTVTTTWNLTSEKLDRGKVGRTAQNIAAETAKELRETPATRDQALRLMRDWIQQNNDIRNVRQGNLKTNIKKQNIVYTDLNFLR